LPEYGLTAEAVVDAAHEALAAKDRSRGR